MRSWFKSLLVGMVGVLLALYGAGCVGQPAPGEEKMERIRLIATSMGSMSYSWSAAVASVLNKEIPEIDWSTSVGMSEENCILINEGDEVAGLSTVRGYSVAYGIEKKRLRTLLCPTFPEVYFFLVPEDFPCDYLHDLPPGQTWSGGTHLYTQTVCEAAFEACGLPPDYVKLLEMGSGATVEAFCDGTIDGASISQPLPSVSFERMATTRRGVKMLKLTPDEYDNWVPLVREKWDCKVVVVESGRVPFATEELQTVGDVYAFIVRDDFPEDLAYRMVKSILENKDKLVAVLAAAEYTTPENAIQYVSPTIMPFHPGAKRYLEEKGFVID